MMLACIACTRRAGPVQHIEPRHLLRPMHSAVVGSPVCADLDGDGRSEIAVGGLDGYFYVLDDELALLPGWPQYSPRGFTASPALADLDGVAPPEIVIASEAGKLHAWRVDSSSAPGWPQELGYRAWSSPATLPGPRVVVGALERVMMFDARGQAAAGWPQPAPYWVGAGVAVAEDLVAATTQLVGERQAGALCAWYVDGEPFPWSPLHLTMDALSAPVLGDLDDDGQPEIVFGDDEGLLHAITLDGRELAGFPRYVDGAIRAAPALGDLDGDGQPEIVVGATDGRLYVWNGRGELLPGWPAQTHAALDGAAVLADLDGDAQLDIVVAGRDGWLYGWTATAEALPDFPHELGAPSSATPWVGDLDDDGRADIVIGADDGLHLFDDVGQLGRVAWPRYHGDDANSGWLHP